MSSPGLRVITVDTSERGLRAPDPGAGLFPRLRAVGVSRPSRRHGDRVGRGRGRGS